MGEQMVVKIKPSCPKCGSKNVSNVTTSLPSRGGGLLIAPKQWPEPYDDPPDKFSKPIMDFNHPYYCNSCKHYFGGSWGGEL